MALTWLEVQLERVKARLDGMITRVVVARVNDALKTQRVQLTIHEEDDVGDGVEHFQAYGMSFKPPVGAEGIALAVGGFKSHTVAFCLQHPDKRPKGLTDEETGGLYTKGVFRLFIDADGLLHIGPDALTHIAEAFIARADKTDAVVAKLQQAFDIHVHATAGTGTPSPPTLPPGPPPIGMTIPIGALDSVAASTGKVT